MSAIFRDGGVYDEVFVMEVVARIAVAEGLSVKRRSARAYDGFDTEIAMIHYPAPPIPKAIIDEMEALVSSGMPQQEVIHQMRAAGLNIVECMKLTSLFYRVDGNEAKRIVHFSDAWANMRGEYDAFHEMAIEAAKQDGWEEVEEGAALRSAS